MGQCRKDVTPLLTHWGYVFLTLTHRYINTNVTSHYQPQHVKWLDHDMTVMENHIRRIGTSTSYILYQSCPWLRKGKEPHVPDRINYYLDNKEFPINIT